MIIAVQLSVCSQLVLIQLLEKCDHDAPLNQLCGFVSCVVMQPGTHILHHKFLVQRRCVECFMFSLGLDYGRWLVVLKGRKETGLQPYEALTA